MRRKETHGLKEHDKVEAMTAFIAARIAEDQQDASKALREDVACWLVERLGGYDRLLEQYEHEDPDVPGGVLQDDDVIAFFGADGLADHIARHDPVRVLRETDARRARLRRYQQLTDNTRTPMDPEAAKALITEYERVILPQDARSWAGHEGYDPAWQDQP